MKLKPLKRLERQQTSVRRRLLLLPSCHSMRNLTSALPFLGSSCRVSSFGDAVLREMLEIITMRGSGGGMSNLLENSITFQDH